MRFREDLIMQLKEQGYLLRNRENEQICKNSYQKERSNRNTSKTGLNVEILKKVSKGMDL